MSIKKKFKKDLSENTELSFDVSQLESNKHVSGSRVKIYVGRIVTACILVPLAIAIVAPLVYVLANMKDSVSDVQRRYTLDEVKNMTRNSFQRLNDINYPKEKGSNSFSDSEKIAYKNYTYDIYQNLERENNMMFSPLSLYGFFVDSYKALSKDSLIQKYESLLGLNESQLVSFYKKLFENNYFKNREGMVELHNGVFIGNDYEINQEYVNYLTKVYTECYSMNFQNARDVDLMVKWVNESVGETNFITKNDVPVTEMTTAYMFSTMNFDVEWSSKFVKSNNHTGYFYLNNNDPISTKFMKHNYVSSYYDYGSYISVKDFYNYQYSITYLVPKKHNDSIYDLVKDKNIFEEDEKCHVDYQTIELHVPKFDITKMFDFEKLIKNLDMGEILHYPNASLNNMYGSSAPGPVFLEMLKQKNSIKLNEDGTTIKSVTIGASGTAKGGYGETLLVELDQPFIYIVKDSSGFPIYVGHMDNPNLKN